MVLITLEPFVDSRGMFTELYSESKYKRSGIDVHFVEDDYSLTKKNVLKGIHGNSGTWKLMTCIQGKIFFVVVDCDSTSKTFGTWESFEFDGANPVSIVLPPLYGNGYVVQSDKAMIHYKQSTTYNPKGQFTYRWDDPKFAIPWPVKNPILTERDANAEYIKIT